jgi:hypothetical protein
MAYYNLRHDSSFSNWVDRRGTLWVVPASSFNPVGNEYFVKCAKHLKTIPVNAHILSSQDDLNVAIDVAFDRCPGCIDEKQAFKSRWPEGAEL